MSYAKSQRWWKAGKTKESDYDDGAGPIYCGQLFRIRAVSRNDDAFVFRPSVEGRRRA